MFIKNQFGKAFRTIRLAKSLTQEDFVQESGRTYISELEREVKHPTMTKVDGLASLLNVHPLTVLTLSYMQNDLSSGACEKLWVLVKAQIDEVLARESSS